MASRFPALQESDLVLLEQQGQVKNKHTEHSTITWLNVFKKWADSRQTSADILSYSLMELNEVLRRFYAEIRREDGRDYGSESLRVMQSSLNRYLVDNNLSKSILTADEFKSSRDVLDGKLNMLRKQETAMKKTGVAQYFNQSDEDILWREGRLGTTFPETLLRTVWYNNSKFFGKHKILEHLNLCLDNFILQTDQTGASYVEFIEEPVENSTNVSTSNMKMWATGGDRCPVALFNLYVSKRPPLLKRSDRFYLQPKNCSMMEDSECYLISALGKNRIGAFKKTLVEGTALEGCGKKIPTYIDLSGSDGMFINKAGDVCTIPVYTTDKKLFPHNEREHAQTNGKMNQGSTFETEFDNSKINLFKGTCNMKNAATDRGVASECTWNSKRIVDHCEALAVQPAPIPPQKRKRVDNRDNNKSKDNQQMSSIFIKIEEESRV